jgi:mevalonate kinase
LVFKDFIKSEHKDLNKIPHEKSSVTDLVIAAAELVVANKELKFQNEEKEKRAAELVIANTELKSQNKTGVRVNLRLICRPYMSM